jgi:MFS transporter, FHS family, glucose/mannose:H+ symporter
MDDIAVQKRKKLIKIILIVNFCLFSLIANTEGPAILAAIKFYNTSYSAASNLPVIRDGLNLIFSFAVFFVLVKIGYRRSLLLGLAFIGIACVIFPFLNNFGALLVLYGAVGAIFAITKICIYTLVTTVTDNRKDHASTISLLEGCYMIAQFASFWIFGLYVGEGVSWTHVYWLFAGIAFCVIIFWFFIPVNETKVRQKDISASKEYGKMGRILKSPLSLIFLIVAAFYLYVEASLFTWLPTFNKVALGMDIKLAVFLASILAGSIAVGRLFGAYFLHKFKWNRYLFVTVTLACIYLVIMLILLKPALIYAQTHHIANWGDLPAIAFLFPMIGLLLGPVYPTLASVTLKSVRDVDNGSMMVLMMIFLAAGGITGQKTIGMLFGAIGPFYAFLSLMIPLIVLWVAVLFFNIFDKKIECSVTESGEK